MWYFCQVVHNWNGLTADIGWESCADTRSTGLRALAEIHMNLPIQFLV